MRIYLTILGFFAVGVNQTWANYSEVIELPDNETTDLRQSKRSADADSKNSIWSIVLEIAEDSTYAWNKINKIKSLLQNSRGKINEQNVDGNTALHLATLITDTDVAKSVIILLLRNGASLNIQNKLKQQPWRYNKILDDTIVGLLRPSDTRIQFDNVHSTFHLGNPNQKLLYVKKVSMLLVKHGVKHDKGVYIDTDVPDAGLFNDIVCRFEMKKKIKVVAYQIKYKPNANTVITEYDLVTPNDNGEFSLLKYFDSYRKIKKNIKNYDEFVIATNIDLAEHLKKNFINTIDHNYFWKHVLEHMKPKAPLSYKFKNVGASAVRMELEKKFRKRSDRVQLIATLYDHVMNEKIITNNELFKKYQMALFMAKIIDPFSTARLHTDFKNNSTQLSEDAQQFRKDFEMYHKDIDPITNLWAKLNTTKSELNVINSFDQCMLADDLEFSTTNGDTKFGIVELVSEFRHAINNAKHKAIDLKNTPQQYILGMTAQTLAGHVIVAEKDKMKYVYKFSSRFLDTSDTSLPPQILEFRTKLRIELNDIRKSQIKFNDLSEYTILLEPTYRQCEDGHQNVNQKLPTNDDVTSDEIKEFFDKLTLVVNLPTEKQLTDILIEESQMPHHKFKMLQKKHTQYEFLAEMSDWLRSKEGKMITEVNMTQMFHVMTDDNLRPIFHNVVKLNEHFVGRTFELEQLMDTRFHKSVITGLGGMGKSQLAAKVAEYYARNQSNVVWINAESFAAIKKSFIDLARSYQLSIPTQDCLGNERDVLNIAQDIYQFLSDSKTLYVFDNVDRLLSITDDENELIKYFPINLPQETYKIIRIETTSKDSRWIDFSIPIRLNTFQLEEAQQFVNKSLSSIGMQDHNNALAVNLYKYPMALQQAITYITKQLKNGFKLYTSVKYVIDFNFNIYGLFISEDFNDRVDSVKNNLYGTLKVSLDQVKMSALGWQASNIFMQMGYLRAENIPIELLTRHDPNYIDAVGLLINYSMIDETDGKLSIQPFVQDVIRTLFVKKDKQFDVLHSIIKLFPNIEKMPFEYIDHALSVWSHICEMKMINIVMEFVDYPAKLLNQLIKNGRYNDAIHFGKFFISHLAKSIETDNITLSLEFLIAKALSDIGQYDEAITICDRILKRCRENDIINMELKTYLVKSLAFKGKLEFTQARQILMEITDRLHTVDNDIRVPILYELAQLYSMDENNFQARKYFIQITTIPRSKFKLKKIEKMYIIADCFSRIDEKFKAISLYEKLRNIDGQSIQEKWNLELKIATIFESTERITAFEKYNELFSSMVKILEKNHPMLLNIELKMAKLRDVMGDLNEALEIYRRNRQRRGGKYRPYNHIIDAINLRINEIEKRLASGTSSSALNCLGSVSKPQCHFTRLDVQQFTTFEFNERHPEHLKIDVEKCLEFIRTKNDVKMNSQLFELLKINLQLKTNIYDANAIMLNDTIYSGGSDALTKTLRVTEVAVLAYNLRKTLKDKLLSWKSKSLKSMNFIIIYNSIRSARELCTKVIKGDRGQILPCVTGIGKALWKITYDPIVDGFVQYSSKFVTKYISQMPITIEYALGFALKHISTRIAPTGARLGILSSLIARSGGKTLKTISTGAGITVCAVFDGIELSYSAYKLGKCLLNANTEAKCSDDTIRENIASIFFSSVLFIAGITALASGVPVIGLLISFGVLVARVTYEIGTSINKQIDEIDARIHTNFDEQTTFAYLFKLSRDTNKFDDILRYIKSKFDDESKTKQSDAIKYGAEFAWKSLQEESSNVVAYGVGLSPYAIIRLDEASKANTNVKGIMPIGSTADKEHFKRICVPHDQEYIESNEETVIDSAIYYCKNALVISDERRSKGNTIILNLGKIETGRIVGSNEHINIFLCFHGTYKVIGGGNTTNVFMFINHTINQKPQVFGGANAMNIIDFSKNIHESYKESGMDIRLQYGHGNIRTYNTYGLYINDKFNEKDDNRTYKYVGKSHEKDKVTCWLKDETERLLIDSGGGLFENKDIVNNCNLAFISPFTNVFGDQNYHYQMYVKTTGYNGTYLKTNFNILNGYASIVFLDFELVDMYSVIEYEWGTNQLNIEIAFGVAYANLFTVTIQNYLVDREMKRTRVSLFDKHNRRIVPKIPEPSFDDKISNHPFRIIDSYEIFANCPSTCNRLLFDDSDANRNCECSDLLNIAEQYNVLTSMSVKNVGDLLIGSHQNDLMYIHDAVRFAKGQSGSDTYIVMDSQQNIGNRTVDIFNCALDNEIDIVHLSNVPVTFFIENTDLVVYADSVKVRVRKFLSSTQCQHLIFMNANKELFIAMNLNVEVDIFARFLYSTPSQISIVLPKELQSDRIVIDAVQSDLTFYKYNNDLLIIRESHNQLIIQLQEFYSDRSKWENISWFLHNNGIFERYNGLEFVDDDVIDYMEKIHRDYINDIKDYKIDFNESYSIRHNHLDYLQDRTGVLLIENQLPNRIKVKSNGNNLVFIDQNSTNTISIEDWHMESYRISMLVFNFLKPITIYGLDKYGLDQVDNIQKLIDIAAENYKLFNQMDALIDVGVQCLIAIDGLNQTIPPYQCNGFNTIEEQYDFVDKYCTNETLKEFRRRATVETVNITAQRLLNDMILKRGIDYDESEYENSLDMCTNQTIRISFFVKLLRDVTLANHGAQFGDEFDIISEFLFWSKNHEQLNLNLKELIHPTYQLLDYIEQAWDVDVDHVKELVKQGADVEIRNSDNQTLLHLAVLRSDEPIIEYLVEVLTPVSVNAVDNYNASVLDYLFEMIQSQFCEKKTERASDYCNMQTFNDFNRRKTVQCIRKKGGNFNRVVFSK